MGSHFHFSLLLEKREGEEEGGADCEGQAEAEGEGEAEGEEEGEAEGEGDAECEGEAEAEGEEEGEGQAEGEGKGEGEREEDEERIISIIYLFIENECLIVIELVVVNCNERIEIILIEHQQYEIKG